MRYHSFNHGNLDCYVLEDRSKVIPLSREFDEDMLKQALHCHHSHGAQNDMVEIGFNYLLVDTGSDKILIDTGIRDGELLSSMALAGIGPDDITHVILTHGDDDHVQGLQHFPDAQIIFPRRSFDMWTNKESRAMLNDEYKQALGKVIASERVEQGISHREHFGTVTLAKIRPKLRLVDDSEEFMPGMRMIHTPGHRSDHYCVSIKSQGATLLVVADAFRHGFQYKRTNLASKYDADSALWTQSLEHIKSLDPDREFLYFGTHFAFPGLLRFDDGLLRPAVG